MPDQTAASTEPGRYTTEPGNEEHHLTDGELRTLIATPGRWSRPLAREVLELRARVTELEAWQSRAMATIRRLFDPETFARLYPDLPPSGDVAVAIDAALDERDRLRAIVARITAMVDHGCHSEDPDDHDCAVEPCWAVALQRALGLEVAQVTSDD